MRHAINLPEVELQVNTSSDWVRNSYGVVTAGTYSLRSATSDVLEIGPKETGFAANFAYAISQHRYYEREMDGLTSRVAF